MPIHAIRRLMRRLKSILSWGDKAGAVLKIIEQNVYTMINNITFSTEMDTLYLIDDGRAIGFPLDNEKGILIGTLKGQLTVATNFQAPPLANQFASIAEGRQSFTKGPDKREIKLPTDLTVWSTVFHKEHRILSFVGATEVEIRVRGEEADYKPELVFFDVESNVLHIQRKQNAIIVKSMPVSEKAGLPDR